MFKEQINKIKALFKKDNNTDKQNDNKKKIENLIAFLIILIITLIAINMILKEDDNTSENTVSQYKELATEEKESVSSNETSSNELEEKIERILETMSGVRRG